MPIDDKESVERLNDLIRESEGSPIGIDSIIDTLIGNDADDEIKELVKLALDSNEKGISMREIVEGIMNLYKWREGHC
ncbi:hypothetical protein OAV46_00935 [Euryarchaeota archaeon]|jgi:hypothetical protein|nr:hypothetical protein [Euryarchaeota archaeon]MDC0962570.1 hypothetical protein [Euryarchaeota archaeon]MDC3247250.1 hypothetical protein [Euryarchaeota archaeon]MDC3281582.1 hypothetical protein [Euryarchaeota archaeon]|tara:strand:- start:140 stop:373 length:234 start_codon:yes stop_codon:yes gene_type:complete